MWTDPVDSINIFILWIDQIYCDYMKEWKAMTKGFSGTLFQANRIT